MYEGKINNVIICVTHITSTTGFTYPILIEPLTLYGLRPPLIKKIFQSASLALTYIFNRSLDLMVIVLLVGLYMLRLLSYWLHWYHQRQP